MVGTDVSRPELAIRIKVKKPPLDIVSNLVRHTGYSPSEQFVCAAPADHILHLL